MGQIALHFIIEINAQLCSKRSVAVSCSQLLLDELGPWKLSEFCVYSGAFQSSGEHPESLILAKLYAVNRSLNSKQWRVSLLYVALEDCLHT